MMSSDPTHATNTLLPATSAQSPQAEVNDHFRRSAGYWREIYERNGVEAALYRLRREAALALIEKLGLPSLSNILEVGCGAGLTAVALAERGYRVGAIDSIAPMVETARKIAQSTGLQDRVRLSLGDVHGLAFQSGKAAPLLPCWRWA
jgi:cyclopropane fatty-acyl-phospholipid synthase-like methyltransferase